MLWLSNWILKWLQLTSHVSCVFHHILTNHITPIWVGYAAEQIALTWARARVGHLLFCSVQSINEVFAVVPFCVFPLHAWCKVLFQFGEFFFFFFLFLLFFPLLYFFFCVGLFFCITVFCAQSSFLAAPKRQKPSNSKTRALSFLSFRFLFFFLCFLCFALIRQWNTGRGIQKIVGIDHGKM